MTAPRTSRRGREIRLNRSGDRRGLVYPAPSPDLPGEEWRPAADFPGYTVSNLGRVRRDEGTWAGCVLVQSPSTTDKWNRWPYATVRLLRPDGKRRHIRVHRLVMATFVGALPEDMEVHHRDGNHWNNELANLEYVTKRLNEDYAKPLRPRGSRHHAAKLTEAAVAEIRATEWDWDSARRLAAKYGVGVGTIRGARDGKTWSHVA